MIVVTGAAGMLGSHTVRALVRGGHEVVGLDLRPPHDPVDEGAYTHRLGDVRDPELLTDVMRGAEAVVHCAAALPSYPPDQIRSIIVDGTTAVLGAAHATGVRRAVHISSTAVYGLPKVVPTPEEHPHAPVDHYSRAKAEAERIASSFRYQGMVLTALRPKTFLGPGRMGLFAMLFQWAQEGRSFPVLGKGDVRIQMLHIDDLVRAVVTALDAPDDAANDTYNIAAAEFSTLREDFQAVLDEAGHGRRVRHLPAAPAIAALTLLEKTGLSPVYGRLLQKLRADSYVSIEKARTGLNFTPRHSNTDAILHTFRWWRGQQQTQQNALPHKGGRTSRDPWRQGVLAAAKVFF